MGGAVYFAWPQPGGGDPMWQLLGSISNNKPSAIFRISRLKQSDENLNITNSFMSLGQGRANAMVGISVEPLVNIQGQTPAAQTEAVKVSTFMEFGQKMVENLFNFSSSFAVTGGEMRARSGETFVPFSCLQQWYNNFERRLQHDPDLEKLSYLSHVCSSGTTTLRGGCNMIQIWRNFRTFLMSAAVVQQL